MKKAVFEIVKGTASSCGAYTHTIFFNGKLLTDEGYWNKDHYNYDNSEKIDYNEFLDIKISDFPSAFHLRMEEWKFYNEFEFVGFLKVTDGIRVEVFSLDSNFEEAQSKWDVEEFIAILRRKVADYHFQSDKFNNTDSVVLEKVYDAEADNKLKAVYDRARNDFVRLYEAVVAELAGN